jgi:hypothetical protein
MKSKIIQDSKSPRFLTSQTDELDASYRAAIGYASSADSNGDVRKDLRDMAWAWTYLFYMRGSRLITGNRKFEGWIGQQRVSDASSSLPPGAKATVDSALFADGR